MTELAEIDLIGAWRLTACVNYRDGLGTPSYGVPPAGQIQYSADGRMSALLMDPAWVERSGPGLPSEVPDSFTEFFAYAGRWRREGERVVHEIELSSVPGKVGTRFERVLRVIDRDTIVLETMPEVSKSGVTYVTHLNWSRYRS